MKRLRVVIAREFPRVICGFPGIGKSYLSEQLGWHDSDSSQFSWSEPKVRNPDFPRNYITHISNLTGTVLASSHEEVRAALADAGIPYSVCYPGVTCKKEYLQRYQDRGSPQPFINLLSAKWEEWIEGMQEDTNCITHHVLRPGQYASDIFGE